MEVVKTRMQLQSELVSLKEKAGAAPEGGAAGGRGSAYRPPYRNAFHAFYKICRDEGFRGIQAGLVPGLIYQVTDFMGRGNEGKVVFSPDVSGDVYACTPTGRDTSVDVNTQSLMYLCENQAY